MNDLRTAIERDMAAAGLPTTTLDDLRGVRDRRRRTQRISAGVVGMAVFALVLTWIGASVLRSDGAPERVPGGRSPVHTLPFAENGPFTWAAGNDLMMEGADRSTPIVLATDVAEDGWTINSFAWSPDGRLIALTVVEPLPQSIVPCRLRVLDVSNGTSIDIADCEHPGFGWQTVDWSPDGRSIVYAGPGGIHVIDADGSDPTQLTDDGGFDPSWSIGDRIIYASGDRRTIVRMASDGTHARIIVEDESGMNPISHPAWSPDGTRIAYLRMEDLPGQPSGSLLGSGLWIAGADGSIPSKAATMECCLGATEAFGWSPDGSELVWTGTEIVFVEADGSGVRAMSRGEAGFPGLDMAVGPSWRPVP